MLAESRIAVGASLTSLTKIVNDCSYESPMESVVRTRIEQPALTSKLKEDSRPQIPLGIDRKGVVIDVAFPRNETVGEGIP